MLASKAESSPHIERYLCSQLGTPCLLGLQLTTITTMRVANRTHNVGTLQAPAYRWLRLAPLTDHQTWQKHWIRKVAYPVLIPELSQDCLGDNPRLYMFAGGPPYQV